MRREGRVSASFLAARWPRKTAMEGIGNLLQSAEGGRPDLRDSSRPALAASREVRSPPVGDQVCDAEGRCSVMPRGVEHPDDRPRDEAASSSRPGAEAQGLVAGRTRPGRSAEANAQGPPEPRGGRPDAASDPGWVIETTFSPFHCLYQDALFF